MTALLDAPAGDTALSRRDRAILELFYASGLRLSELTGLDVEDVNLSARMVRVLGKGRKERIVPFNGTTAAAVRAYLKDRERLIAAAKSMPSAKASASRSARAERHGRRREPLFVNYRGGRLTVRSVDRLVRRYVGGKQLREPASARTRCGTHSPRICSSAAPTCGDPGTAGARAPQHDAALHARQRRAAARGLPKSHPRAFKSCRTRVPTFLSTFLFHPRSPAVGSAGSMSLASAAPPAVRGKDQRSIRRQPGICGRIGGLEDYARSRAQRFAHE